MLYYVMSMKKHDLRDHEYSTNNQVINTNFHICFFL